MRDFRGFLALDFACLHCLANGSCQTALAHGHDAVVLGAFGCGAFRNPAQHVSQLFKEVRTVRWLALGCVAAQFTREMRCWS